MTATVQSALQARVKRTDLTRALKHVAAAVDKKPAIPVLGCVRLEVLPSGFMTLLGTDFGSAMRVTIPVENGQAGVVLAPARQLHTLLTFSMEDDVELVQVGLNLNVRTGTDQFTLCGLDEDHFPKIDSAEGLPFFVISRNDLAEISTACGPVCGKDESKPWLQNIHLKVTDTLQATSTDGVRIAAWDKAVTIDNRGQALVMPTVVRMAVQLATPGEQISVAKFGNQIKFTGHGFEVWGLLSTGEYPDVRKHARDDYPVQVIVDRLALLTAMRAARVLSKAGEVRLSPGSSWFQVSVNTPEVGSFSRLLPATVSREMSTVSFNSDLVFKLLESFRGNEVQWGFSNTREPARLACPDQPHMWYVILPLLSFPGE